jgi:hypothetical protein
VPNDASQRSSWLFAFCELPPPAEPVADVFALDEPIFMDEHPVPSNATAVKPITPNVFFILISHLCAVKKRCLNFIKICNALDAFYAQHAALASIYLSLTAITDP